MSEILSKNYIGFHVKYPLFLFDFNETSNFMYSKVIQMNQPDATMIY